MKKQGVVGLFCRGFAGVGLFGEAKCFFSFVGVLHGLEVVSGLLLVVF